MVYNNATILIKTSLGVDERQNYSEGSSYSGYFEAITASNAYDYGDVEGYNIYLSIPEYQGMSKVKSISVGDVIIAIKDINNGNLLIDNEHISIKKVSFHSFTGNYEVYA